MKKLMFVAAAALCATVPCNALESANVVGYSSAELRNNGFAASGASFAATSGTMDLQDLSVSGYDHADGFEGDVYVEFLDNVGRATAIYSWVDVPADPEDAESVAYYGWYDGDTLVEDVTINAGTALWTYSDSNAYSLVFPGFTL